MLWHKLVTFQFTENFIFSQIFDIFFDNSDRSSSKYICRHKCENSKAKDLTSIRIRWKTYYRGISYSTNSSKKRKIHMNLTLRAEPHAFFSFCPSFLRSELQPRVVLTRIWPTKNYPDPVRPNIIHCNLYLILYKRKYD